MTARAVALMLRDDVLLLVRGCVSSGMLRLEAVEKVPLPKDEEAARVTARRLAEQGFLGHHTAMVVPSSRAFVLFHHPSVSSRSAVRETLRYDVERDLPADVEGMALDFDDPHVADRTPPHQLIVGAVRRETLAEQLAALRELGLAPTQATLEPVALANAYRTGSLLNGDERVLGVHLASDGVAVVRLAAGVPEDLRGFLADTEPNGAIGVMPPLLRFSLAEAAITRDLDRLYVSGPAILAKQVAGQMESEFGLRASDPAWGAVDLSGLSPEELTLLQEEGPPLIGALTEALGVGPSAVSLNLLDRGEVAEGWLAFLRKPSLGAAALLILLCGLWALSGTTAAQRAEARRTATAAELTRLWHGVRPGEPLPMDVTRAFRSEMLGREGQGGVARRPLAVLDVLGRVTEASESDKDGVPYHRIHIAGNTVALEGTASDYEAVDRLVARLRDKGRFEADTPEMALRSGRVTFRVELQEAVHE